MRANGAPKDFRDGKIKPLHNAFRLRFDVSRGLVGPIGRPLPHWTDPSRSLAGSEDALKPCLEEPNQQLTDSELGTHYGLTLTSTARALSPSSVPSAPTAADRGRYRGPWRDGTATRLGPLQTVFSARPRRV